MQATWKNYLLSLAVAAVTALVGVVAQATSLPWLVAILAGLLAAPGPVRKVLTSFEFVATVVLVLTLATIVGTFDYALNVFESLWFLSLSGLIGLSSLMCVLFKYRTGKGATYLIVHLSIIIILVGGGMKMQMKRQGMVHLLEGQASSEMQVFRNGQPVDEYVPLPFSIRLDRFNVEFYDTALELYVFRQETQEQAAVLATEPGKETTVDGVRIKFLALRDHPFVPTPGHPPVKMILAEIEVDGQKGFVMEGRPVTRGNLALVLHKKQGEPKSYQSTITVVDDQGQEVVTRSVVVNDPLIYGGWWLYQSNWDPQNLSYSGILVVSDPGLYVALGGLVLLAIGTIAKIRFRKPRKEVMP
jgi:hypothetical protein